MIGLFKQNGAKLPITYRGLTLNDPNDDPKDTFEVWNAMVDAEHAAIAEPKMQRDGSEIYRPRKQRRLIRLTGAIKAVTAGALYDKMELLAEAFDPVNAFLEDESEVDVGFLPFQFSRPTDDTANFPSGLKDLEYYARPLAIPVTRVTKNDGKSAEFAALLECADPRGYARADSTIQVVNAGSTALDNSLATYSSWPVLTVTLSGASGVIRFERTWSGGSKHLDLDLSALVATDVVIVDMEQRTIELNGASAMDLYDGGDFWWVPWGESATFTVSTVSGTAFAGTAQVLWRKAFA